MPASRPGADVSAFKKHIGEMFLSWAKRLTDDQGEKADTLPLELLMDATLLLVKTAVEEEREACAMVNTDDARSWERDAKYRAGRNEPDSAHVSRERAAILRQCAALIRARKDAT